MFTMYFLFSNNTVPGMKLLEKKMNLKVVTRSVNM